MKSSHNRCTAIPMCINEFYPLTCFICAIWSSSFLFVQLSAIKWKGDVWPLILFTHGACNTYSPRYPTERTNGLCRGNQEGMHSRFSPIYILMEFDIIAQTNLKSIIVQKRSGWLDTNEKNVGGPNPILVWCIHVTMLTLLCLISRKIWHFSKMCSKKSFSRKTRVSSSVWTWFEPNYLLIFSVLAHSSLFIIFHLLFPLLRRSQQESSLSFR